MADDEPARSRNAPVLMLFVSWALAAAYIGVYVGNSTTTEDFLFPRRARYFNAQWKVDLFSPAARVESLFAGKPVDVELKRPPPPVPASNGVLGGGKGAGAGGFF